MAIDVTVGGPTAVSWASVSEYRTYATYRLPAIAVAVDALDAAVEVALVVACRMIGNDFVWTGAAVDSAQALSWPRSGMLTRNGYSIPTTTNPLELKNAQCEMAYEMLGGIDLTADNDAVKSGLSSLSAGSVSLAWQSMDISSVAGLDNFIRRLNSEFNYVSDQVKGEVRRMLVPSWFEQPSIIRPIMFNSFSGRTV